MNMASRRADNTRLAGDSMSAAAAASNFYRHIDYTTSASSSSSYAPSASSSSSHASLGARPVPSDPRSYSYALHTHAEEPDDSEDPEPDIGDDCEVKTGSTVSLVSSCLRRRSIWIRMYIHTSCTAPLPNRRRRSGRSSWFILHR